MLRKSELSLHMMPRNRGMAPRWDAWSDKYDPWSHLRRMAKLVGTGFYIPPNWYNHFRMFPPIQHSFKEEKTLNPQTVEELTQEQFNTISDERKMVREELAKKSRTLASSGMRYYNIFWVEKPLDDAERQYYVLRKSNGLSHEEAIKKVLADFYEKQALRRRAHMIQSEEAQMTGKFLTMREAMSVVQLLGDAQRLGLAPHQFSEIASRTKARSSGSSNSSSVSSSFEDQHFDSAANSTMDTRVEKELVTESSTSSSISADSLHDLLSGSGSEDATTKKTTNVQSTQPRSKIVDRIVVSDSSSDSIDGLKNLATSSTGKTDWLDEAEGHSPKYNTGAE